MGMAVCVIARHGLFAGVVVAGLLSGTHVAAEPCDGEAGRRFATACLACHNLREPVHMPGGPHLLGLFGRPAGSSVGYRFSAALRESGLIWNEETLDRFLEAPRSFVPGTTMTMAGIRQPERRSAIICWLKETVGEH